MRCCLPDDVLRARIASDDKYIRRIAKRVTAVASARTPEERANTALLLRTDLELFSAHIERLGVAARDTSEREKTEYHDEIARIERQSVQDRAQIAALKEELAAAEHTRQNRLEYDNIANKILVYPSRAELKRYVYANSAIAAQEKRIAFLDADTSALEQVTTETVESLAGIGAQMRELHTTVNQRLTTGEQNAPEQESGGDAGTEAAPDPDTPALNPEAEAFKPRSHKRNSTASDAPAKRPRRGRRTD